MERPKVSRDVAAVLGAALLDGAFRGDLFGARGVRSQVIDALKRRGFESLSPDDVTSVVALTRPILSAPGRDGDAVDVSREKWMAFWNRRDLRQAWKQAVLNRWHENPPPSFPAPTQEQVNLVITVLLFTQVLDVDGILVTGQPRRVRSTCGTRSSAPSGRVRIWTSPLGPAAPDAPRRCRGHRGRPGRRTPRDDSGGGPGMDCRRFRGRSPEGRARVPKERTAPR